MPNRLFGPWDITRIKDFSQSGKTAAQGGHINEYNRVEMIENLKVAGFKSFQTIIPIPKLKYLLFKDISLVFLRQSLVLTWRDLEALSLEHPKILAKRLGLCLLFWVIIDYINLNSKIIFKDFMWWLHGLHSAATFLLESKWSTNVTQPTDRRITSNTKWNGPCIFAMEPVKCFPAWSLQISLL